MGHRESGSRVPGRRQGRCTPGTAEGVRVGLEAVARERTETTRDFHGVTAEEALEGLNLACICKG